MPEIRYNGRWDFHRHEYQTQWPWILETGKQMSIADDPVRPELSLEFRLSHGREIYSTRGAIVCIAYCNDIPKKVDDLNKMAGLDNAIFYTVWSYRKGAGRDIITLMLDYFKTEKPWLKRFVTLSPKTEMAHNFHLNNGAVVLQRNRQSVNYEYILL